MHSGVKEKMAKKVKFVFLSAAQTAVCRRRRNSRALYFYPDPWCHFPASSIINWRSLCLWPDGDSSNCLSGFGVLQRTHFQKTWDGFSFMGEKDLYRSHSQFPFKGKAKRRYLLQAQHLKTELWPNSKRQSYISCMWMALPEKYFWFCSGTLAIYTHRHTVVTQICSVTKPLAYWALFPLPAQSDFQLSAMSHFEW